MKADVTIIIPCYKVGKFLRACLDSVCRQTYRSIRAIAVDDCSPDDTREIIREYAARDARIEGLFLEQNSGVSVARNRGMEAADSEWLMFLDGDDYLTDEAVERLMALQEKSGADLVCGNAREYDGDGVPLGRWTYAQTGVAQVAVTPDLNEVYEHRGVFCTCWGKLFRRSTVEKVGVRFNSALRHAQDTMFTHQVVLECKPSIVVDYGVEIVCYRQHDASCVHAIPLDKRLNYLNVLITELDKLCCRLNYPRKLVSPKASEYIWAIKKFSRDSQERSARGAELLASPLFTEHISPVVKRYGKFKHRFVLALLEAGHLFCLRFW